MPRLLLVRHGNTDLNTARMFVGHSDVELNDAGYRQAERLRERLAEEKIDLIYSSDLRRALATAEIISTKHKASIIACPELREINYGRLERLTFEEINCLYPAVAELCINWNPQLKFPDGESFDEFKERVGKFLGRLKNHTPEQTILVVAHGGPLRLILCCLLGIDLWHSRQIRIDLASLSIVDEYPEIAIVSLLNDTSHLRLGS